jgi:ethanolamine transporter EutH
MLLELPVQISRDVAAISKLSVVLAPGLRFCSAKIRIVCHVYSLWYKFVLWCVRIALILISCQNMILTSIIPAILKHSLYKK